MAPGNTCFLSVRRIALRAICSGLIVTLGIGLWGCGLPGLLLILPGIQGPVCYEELGPCPPPEPGVLLNNANISRSIWFEDERIGAPDDSDLTRSLCQADLDRRPGEEFVFRGDEGLTVLASEAGSPSTIAFIPAEQSWKVVFLDVNGDGETEFLYDRDLDFGSELELWNHAGGLQWSRSWIHRISNDSFLSYGDWQHADFDGDGDEEFAITPVQGVDIIEAGGSVVGSLATDSVWTIRIGDVTGDGILEIVTQTVEGTITIWANDATEINSFVPSEHSSSRIRMIRPLDSDRDQILLNCSVYDIDGSVVTRLEEDEGIPGYFPVEEVEYGRLPIESQSCTVSFFIDEPIEHEMAVRFAVDQEPFLVHLSYSIDFDPPAVAGPIPYQATRTILRIFNPEGRLVYHEVLESASTPGSAAVIPSDVPGEELLLVADDARILAYFLGEN